MGSWRESGWLQSTGQGDRIWGVIHAELGFCSRRWRAGCCAALGCCAGGAEGKLCSDQCYLFGVMLGWCQWLTGFDGSYLLILKKELMNYLTWELLSISDLCWVSAAEFFCLFWPLLFVQALLELNFHKLILAPRTSSKVEVFSYRRKTGQCMEEHVASSKQSDTLRCAAVEFSPGSSHVWAGWMEGACLLLLCSFSWHGDVAGCSSLCSVQPGCRAVLLLLPWTEEQSKEQGVSRDLSHCHWHTGGHKGHLGNWQIKIQN